MKVDMTPLPIAEIVALANAIGVKIDMENMSGVRFVLDVNDAPRCEVEYVGRSKERLRETPSGSIMAAARNAFLSAPGKIDATGEKRDE